MRMPMFSCLANIDECSQVLVLKLGTFGWQYKGWISLFRLLSQLSAPAIANMHCCRNKRYDKKPSHTSKKKTLANHCVAKTCSHTNTKIKIQSCLTFEMTKRIATFLMLQFCIQEQKHRSRATDIACQIIKTPPVFLNYLSNTNNNNGLSMSNTFTSESKKGSIHESK